MGAEVIWTIPADMLLIFLTHSGLFSSRVTLESQAGEDLFHLSDKGARRRGLVKPPL